MRITTAKYFGNSNKKVVLLIGGWTYTQSIMWLPSKILARHGYYCITYTYPVETFSTDFKKTVNDLTEIKNEILHDIEQLKKAGYESFSVFGTSLGTVLATLVANESSEITKVILNTTGADTAISVWSWDNVVPGFKKALLEQNLTLEKLTHYWRPISPRFHMDKLQGKKLLIYLAKNDQIIPYSQGEALIQKCKEYNYNYQVIINNYFNHGLTGIYNLLNLRSYLKFLED